MLLNRYYELNKDFIFKIKEVHKNEMGDMVEISDWIGKDIMAKIDIKLNNGNALIKLRQSNIQSCKLLEDYEVRELITDELSYIAKRGMIGDAFSIRIKKTPERQVLWETLYKFGNLIKKEK